MVSVTYKMGPDSDPKTQILEASNDVRLLIQNYFTTGNVVLALIYRHINERQLMKLQLNTFSIVEYNVFARFCLDSNW